VDDGLGNKPGINANKRFIEDIGKDVIIVIVKYHTRLAIENFPKTIFQIFLFSFRIIFLLLRIQFFP